MTSGGTMDSRRRKQLDELHADQLDIHNAIKRIQAERGQWAGLADDRYGHAAVELLEGLAAHLGLLSWRVRGPVVRISRELGGRPMDDPRNRRTRMR